MRFCKLEIKENLSEYCSEISWMDQSLNLLSQILNITDYIELLSYKVIELLSTTTELITNSIKV